MQGTDPASVTPSQAEFYSRLEVAQVLGEYDGPVLFLAVDPTSVAADTKYWLINWRSGGTRSAKSPALRELSGVERWLAVPVSERRKSQVLAEHVSLRESILLAEGRIYLLEGGDPLRPESVRGVEPPELDRALLPTGDATVFGNSMRPPGLPVDPGALRVLIHVVPGSSGPESPALADSAVIQECLQRFVSWTSRAMLFREGPREAGVPSAIPVMDWAGLTLVAAASGTLTVVARADIEGEARREAVLNALRILKPISEGRFDEAITRTVGSKGASSLLALMGIIRSLHLSVSLKWGFGDDEEFAMIGESTADWVHDQLQRLADAEEAQLVQTKAAEFIVHLTGPEVSELLRDVDPRGGGFQALIATLQHQLEGNDLKLTPHLVERVIRYVQDYGEGTYENRLRPIYEAIHRYGLSFVGLR